MIVKVILDTNQEVEIYNSLNDINNSITVLYRQIMNGMALSIFQETVNELLLYPVWNELMQAMKENSEETSIQSIMVINDENKVIFEKNNIINYLYNATFSNFVKENIDFEFAE